MKKGGVFLIILTIAFVGFVAGMLVGRNMSKSRTTIQVLSENSPVEVTSSQPTVIAEEKININTASAKILDTLPGIGPVLAQRIVDYRTENGLFTHPSDISKVEGIGPEKLLALLDYITVED